MARRALRAGNLPVESTSFIGRRRELAELRQKLSTARLVSLVGPGGVGKTRLAIRIAADLARGVRDGAWLVELADVRDPALVSNAVLAALDLRDQAATVPHTLLLAYLRDQERLLVLDNCEHLLDAVAQLVADVLRAAPGVRVLTTSREPLSIDGEHVIPVPPLDLPSTAAAEPLAQRRQNEAVMLFVGRAAAAAGSFELTGANQAAVVDVCRRLDGLPLAIELAAVRTRVLSVEQIRDRLTDHFALLTGGSRAALPRQQTLRTALDWSHDLLDAAERTLLRRLCVFAGRFTLEDVESVCTTDGVSPAAVLEVLSSLVDKSLVMKEERGDRACYRLHETMREYARLQLRAAGEEEAVELRCTQHYVSRCRTWAATARYRLPEWLDWIEPEIDTIRSILRRCLDCHDLRNGVDLATLLTYYWITRATTEGVQWLDAFLTLAHGTPAAHAWAYHVRGFLGVLQGDGPAARAALGRAVAAAHQTGQLAVLSQSLAMASIAENMAGDRRVASKRLLDQAEGVAAAVDDVPARLMLLQAQALSGLFENNLETVSTAAAEHGEAGLHRSAAHRHQIDDRIAQYYVLDALGCHAAGSGQARLAAQLFGAAERVRAGVGTRGISFLGPHIAEAKRSATAALGASVFQAELEAGRRLSRGDAIALALGESAPAATARPSSPSLLGTREAEVTTLVADGLSNKQIAARLFISERTVDSHVRSILNELGVNSRAQIAGWVRASAHGPGTKR